MDHGVREGRGRLGAGAGAGGGRRGAPEWPLRDVQLTTAPGWPAAGGRRGTSRERFGIFRDFPATGEDKRGRKSATRWAVITVMIAMITLFICLLLIDFTRTDINTAKKVVNASSRSMRQDNKFESTSNRPFEERTFQISSGMTEKPYQYSAVNTNYDNKERKRHHLNVRTPIRTQSRYDDDNGLLPMLPQPIPRTGSPEIVLAYDQRNETNASKELEYEEDDVEDITDPTSQEITSTYESKESAARDYKEYREQDFDKETALDLSHASQENFLLSPEIMAEEVRQTPLMTYLQVPNETNTVEYNDGGEKSARSLPATVVSPKVNKPPSSRIPMNSSSQEKAESAESTMALPYRSQLELPPTPVRWRDFQVSRETPAIPPMSPEERERLMEILRAQYQIEKTSPFRRQIDIPQRKNFISEGTIEGEQIIVPQYTPTIDAFTVLSNAQKVENTLGPKKVFKMVLQSNPRPFRGNAQPVQNQYLVVNNKGVVIPHSTNFPEVVKAANYPQLQSYRNQQQGSRNIQDIIKYLTNKGIGLVSNALGTSRPNMWSLPTKKTAKVSGLYVAPHPEYENSFVYPRPEAYVNENIYVPTEKVTETLDKPDIPYNGHAYIADPFHPYKPSDPTEINQLASTYDSQGTGSSLDPVRFADSSNSQEQTYTFIPRHAIQGHGKGRLPFAQQMAHQYTTAIFKPLNSDSLESNSPSGLTKTSTNKKRSPLSVMLEIYPMGEENRKTPLLGVRPLPVKPAAIQPILLPESTVRKPVTASIDTPHLSFQHVIQPRFPQVSMMQGHLHNPNGQPAYGITIKGLQGLQASGMPMPDSKHRMIVHLNFYPKKTVTMPTRYHRDQASETVSQGASLIPGGLFPQRRQSGDYLDDVDDSSEDHTEPASLSLDIAPLLKALPPQVRQYLSDILLSYQHPTVDNEDDTSYEDGEVDDEDDEEDSELAGDESVTMFTSYGRTNNVDAKPSPSEILSQDDSDGLQSRLSPAWLYGKGSDPIHDALPNSRVMFKPNHMKKSKKSRESEESYFDVQENDTDFEGEDLEEEFPSNNRKTFDNENLESAERNKKMEAIRNEISQRDATKFMTRQEERHRKYLEEMQRELEAEEKRLEKKEAKKRKLGRKKNNLDQNKGQNDSSVYHKTSDEKGNEKSFPKNHRKL